MHALAVTPMDPRSWGKVVGQTNICVDSVSIDGHM